jgi:hypothetical protein
MARETSDPTYDEDTGIPSALVTYSKTLSYDEAVAMQADLQRVVLGNTDLNYVIGDDERALREGRWTPHNAAELIAAIDHLRRCLKDDMPRETLAVAALRVGRLHTEAVAKSQWPVVAVGRTHRRQMRGAAAIKNKRWQAGRRKLAAAVAAYRRQHPTASTRAIALALLPKLRRPVKLDALRKRISRLPK